MHGCDLLSFRHEMDSPALEALVGTGFRAIRRGLLIEDVACPLRSTSTTTSTATTGAAEAAVRRSTYGEDIGQSSWMTRGVASVRRSASGGPKATCWKSAVAPGPAVHLAAVRGCQVTGVDINDNGVRNAAATGRGPGCRGSGDLPGGGRQSTLPSGGDI